MDIPTSVAKFGYYLIASATPRPHQDFHTVVKFQIRQVQTRVPGSDLLHHEGLDLVVEELCLEVGLVGLVELLQDHGLGNGHAYAPKENSLEH